MRNGWRFWLPLSALVIGILGVVFTWHFSEGARVQNQIDSVQNDAQSLGALHKEVELEKEKLDRHLQTAEPLIQDLMVMKAEMPYIRQELIGLRADLKELGARLDQNQKVMIEILQDEQKMHRAQPK